MEYAFLDQNGIIDKVIYFPLQFTGETFPELIGAQFNEPPIIFGKDTLASIELFTEDELAKKNIYKVRREELKKYQEYGNPYYDSINKEVIYPSNYLMDIDNLRNIRFRELDYLAYNILNPKTDMYAGDWLEIKSLRGDVLDDEETIQMQNRINLRNAVRNIKIELNNSSDMDFIANYNFNL